MIYLMRHGQDDENYIGGWSDVSLIPDGVRDVNNQSLWIKDNLKINKIVCSNVLRAKETAEIVNSYLNTDIMYSDDLREQNKGLLNGILKESIKDSYPNYYKGVGIDVRYPNGESLRDLYNRMKIYINKVMEMDDDTLIITHRGVINMFYYILNGIPLDNDKKRFNVETASIHELDKVNKLIKRIK